MCVPWLCRICITDGTANGAVCLEEGIEEGTLDELRRRGHKLLAGEFSR